MTVQGRATRTGTYGVWATLHRRDIAGTRVGKVWLERVFPPAARRELESFADGPCFVEVSTRRGTPVLVIRAARAVDYRTLCHAAGGRARAQGLSLQVFDQTKPAARAAGGYS